MRQTSWVRSGSSYCSASELKAFFGLGSATKIDRLEVRWPEGTTEEVRDAHERFVGERLLVGRVDVHVRVSFL